MFGVFLENLACFGVFSCKHRFEMICFLPTYRRNNVLNLFKVKNKKTEITPAIIKKFSTTTVFLLSLTHFS